MSSALEKYISPAYTTRGATLIHSMTCARMNALISASLV